ncbi:MAG: hypothetical protein GF419_12015 [Ignavibacteriales bacterium]|nr:hypothetical protein [Ignavibacteriales bacterium]
MSQRTFHFLAAILALGLFGCAATRMTSFVDPAYRGQKFTRLLVVADVPNLETRLQLENRMVESFREAGIDAIPGSNLFPPTREISEEEAALILKENKIEAYLEITPTDAGVETVALTPDKKVTETETETRGHFHWGSYGGSYSGSASATSETYSVEGRKYNLPWAVFSATMYDAETGATVWIANANTGGNAYATMQIVFGSFCDSVVDRLAEDRLIVKIVGK